jgi:hypothetical protein
MIQDKRQKAKKGKEERQYKRQKLKKEDKRVPRALEAIVRASDTFFEEHTVGVARSVNLDNLKNRLKIV